MQPHSLIICDHQMLLRGGFLCTTITRIIRIIAWYCADGTHFLAAKVMLISKIWSSAGKCELARSKLILLVNGSADPELPKRIWRLNAKLGSAKYPGVYST